MGRRLPPLWSAAIFADLCLRMGGVNHGSIAEAPPSGQIERTTNQLFDMIDSTPAHPFSPSIGIVRERGETAIRILSDLDALIDRDAVSARRALLNVQVLIQDLPLWEGRPSAVVERPLGAAPPAQGGEASGAMAPWRLRRVLAFIQTRLHGGIGVCDMAEVAGLSISHFCRAFKASTGAPPHAYVMRMRLEKAQALMIETDDTLGLIAEACGLADQAHLTRLFRRHMNTTPYRWRRARRVA